eukprot:CAMPEP_0113914360 /NCGR_PEP_ID=MMETSP0780_2-20120614/30319_1 /TAXON_ID=652834 /ORGANISM="Palpitomonas bilix" /LENGTH=559 /DNA_ID=CAMNT_0000912181 /DNA_START=28 /DNA_END=1707 /DNA_ORIENTATION=- /assembly_acc=CAM_ASM_000599
MAEPAADLTPEQLEEKKKIAEERERRKAEKAAKQAAKKAKKAGGGQQQQQPSVEAIIEKINFLSVDDAPKATFGDYEIIRSVSQSGRKWTDVSKVDASLDGQEVWLRGRIHSSRSKGNSCFLVLRQQVATIQAAMFKGGDVTKEMIKFSASIPKESVVDILGKVVTADVKSCTQSDCEISVSHIYCVSRAAQQLPFQLEDASRSEEEIVASEAAAAADESGKTGSYVRVNQDTRLDNRILDLRVPANHAIMRIKSAVCMYYREALMRHGFLEIQSPKIISAASESGAHVFKLDYFDRPAFLAQSPQFYKQMAISSDLDRVFEIAPVFRAETSRTHRHLTEFIGLDMEMTIKEHYFEVLDVLEDTLIHVFHSIVTNFAEDLKVISQQFPFKPFDYDLPPKRNPRVTYPEGIAMLREAGVEIGDYDDLNTEKERLLGKLVKEKYGSDFYILHMFPAEIRPFYTMPHHENEKYSTAYDIFMRGEEICSGAQRIHDPQLLAEKAEKFGLDPSTIKDYIDCFRLGSFPHGGGGIGLERVVMLFLGLNNVKKVSMFPRDPDRLTP